MWGSKPPIQLSSDASGGESDDSDSIGFVPVAAQGGSVVRLVSTDGRPRWTARGEATVSTSDQQSEFDGTTLRVEGNGELSPTVSVSGRVRDTDLTRYRSVTATVMPGSLRRTSAPLRARLRLRHGADQTRGATAPGASHSPHRGRGDDGPTERSLTSRTFHAPQGQPIRLYWDLRGVEATVLRSATALNLVFERADRPASKGPYGRGATGVEGSVHIDSVVLSDSPDVVSAARLQTHWQRLEAGYGRHETTITERKTETVESGCVRFGDGTDIPFELAMHDGGSHTFTLGDERYEFADGMAAVEPR